MKIKFSVLVLASFLTLSSCKTTSISTETKKNNLKEIRKDDAFNMEEALRQKLGDLCETYYVENADKIIDFFIIEMH